MSELDLTFEVDRTTWISGETPRFWVSLTNRGVANVPVPTLFSSGFITVSVRDASTGESAVYSQGLPSRLRRPDRRPIPDTLGETDLPPGEMVRYFIDLDDFLPQLPQVGSCQMQIALRTGSMDLHSDPLELSVTPLLPVAANSITDCENQLLRQIVVHREPSGRVLFVRESVPRHPAANGFRRVAEGLSANVSAAVSMPLRPLLNTVTVAALADGILRIGSIESGLTTEQPIELTEPVIHPFGWQIDDASSEFLLLGREGDLVTALFVKFDQEASDPVSVDAMTLPLKTIPTLWRAQRLAHEASWTLVYGDDSSLMRLSVNRAGCSPPELLVDERGPLKALAMYPIGEASAEAVAALTGDEPNYSPGAPIDAIDAVFGPFVENRESCFAFRRVDASTAITLSKIVFSPPEGVPADRLDWLLSNVTGAEPFAAAILGNRMLGVGDGATMEVLSDGMTGTRAHAIDWFGNAYLLSWISREGNPVFRVMK